MADNEDVDRAGSAMRAALVGQPMRSFSAVGLVGPSPRLGRIIEAVETSGTHLVIRWDDDLVLHSHLKLSGAWHLYREDEPWRRSQFEARANIGADGWVAVCFNAPIIETYRTLDRRRHPAFGMPGPDLCDSTADLDRVIDAMVNYRTPESYISEVLTDQRVMTGLGNVMRSELLWLLELSPWAMLCDLTRDDVTYLIDHAVTLLGSVLGAAPRTMSADGLYVYGRTGQACQRCHDTIQMHRIGAHGRALYWCEGCQTHLDSRPVAEPVSADPHPAATMFLDEASRNRLRTG
jgi:endonuclease-8